MDSSREVEKTVLAFYEQDSGMNVLSQELSGLGFKVLSFRNKSGAPGGIPDEEYDIAILYRLSSLGDCLRLTGKIRRKSHVLPIIAVIEVEQEESWSDILEAGADEIFLSTDDMATVVERIRFYVSLASASSTEGKGKKN